MYMYMYMYIYIYIYIISPTETDFRSPDIRTSEVASFSL